MKKAISLAILMALAACSQPVHTSRIFRYPDASAPATELQPGMRFLGSGTVVDYHNHDLTEPEEGQRWLLVPGAFLLTLADGTILESVPAAYRGR